MNEISNAKKARDVQEEAMERSLEKYLELHESNSPLMEKAYSNYLNCLSLYEHSKAKLYVLLEEFYDARNKEKD